MDLHYAAVGGCELPQESAIAHSCIYIKYIQLKLPNFKNNNDAYIPKYDQINFGETPLDTSKALVDQKVALFFADKSGLLRN